MDVFLVGPIPVGRDEALASLRSALPKLLGRDAAILSAAERGEDADDLMASDGAGGLVAIRWVGQGKFESDLFALLLEAVRWRERTRGRVQCLFVSDDVPATWLEVAGLIDAPIRFVKAHRLASHATGNDAIYLEVLSPRSGGEAIEALSPRSEPSTEMRTGDGDLYRGLSPGEIASFKALEALLRP